MIEEKDEVCEGCALGKHHRQQLIERLDAALGQGLIRKLPNGFRLPKPLEVGAHAQGMIALIEQTAERYVGGLLFYG